MLCVDEVSEQHVDERPFNGVSAISLLHLSPLCTSEYPLTSSKRQKGNDEDKPRCPTIDGLLCGVMKGVRFTRVLDVERGNVQWMQ